MFRDIDRKNVSIKRFETNKTFTLTNNDSGSGLFAVRAVSKSLYNYDSGSDIITTITSGSITTNYYALPTWHTINKMYYKDASNPIGVFGNSNTTSIKRELHTSASVFSIPKDLFGERIKPGTFELSDTSRGTTFDIRDDGDGNLYDFAFSSSFSAYKSSSFDRTQGIDSNGSGSQVGNIFYEQGIIVLTDTGSLVNAGAKRNGTGTDYEGHSLKYKATRTIYEYEYTITIEPNEYNLSTNRSTTEGLSGSLGIAEGTTDLYKFLPPGDQPTNGTGSFKSFYNPTTNLQGFVSHSEFKPYLTSVGLYNDNNELLVVGKLAQPIKLKHDSPLSIVVRFDI